MIDRRGRDQYAELLRHLAAGRLAIEDHAQRAEAIVFPDGGRQDDVVLVEIRCRVDDACDEVGGDAFTGEHRLSRSDRREVAKWIVFLHSGCAYEWPSPPVLGPLLIAIASCFTAIGPLAGWPARWLIDRLHEHRLRRLGDVDAWPFLFRADMDDALARPRLLCGAAF